ncbi:MAG: DUF6352 family protein [Burkholderiales bacterium]
MADFWRNSGFRLLERDPAGRLRVSDDFLRAYYLRPEIHPVDESGDAEVELHRSLMAQPRRAVAQAELDALEDRDVKDSYAILLRFRHRLLEAGTLEGCYMSLFKSAIDVPPMFVDQLAHVILRNILDGCDDALQLRAAELFFREQKATIRDGHVLLADHETVEMHASGHRYGALGRLIVEAQGEIAKADLDVLDRANAALYWEREPRRAVSEQELDALEDRDVKDNYSILLRFRQKLLDAGTVEGCYRSLFKGGVDVPPMFVDQLVHVILRSILDGSQDPLELRAAELFFREQKATIRDGHVLLADLETVEMHASGHRYGSIGRLIVEAQGDLGSVDLDVLDRPNAAIYWERESRHDTVISLTYGRPALDAFCRVIEAWIFHFLKTKVQVKPLRKIEEPRWAWHIGLDAESSAILNALWSGEEVEQGRMRRILSLFQLHFDDPALMRPEMAGRAVYLGLSCDENQLVRMKPQNLLINLPVHEA